MNYLSEYVAYLACPDCKGDLEYIESPKQSFRCLACSKTYPVIDGIPRLLEVNDELLAETKKHWEDSPLFQYEAESPLYSVQYYKEMDRWRREEIDPFNLHEYRFEDLPGKVVLDVGNGPGWIVMQAAMHGAKVIGVDFAERAVQSARRGLDIYNLRGLVVQADAQHLPIKDNAIDRVYSCGVLHHIPDTEKGVEEVHRVMKPNGSGYISFYDKAFFYKPLLFPVTTWLMRLLLKAPNVRSGLQYSKTYDEFSRQIDGPSNPIGRFYDRKQLAIMLSKFTIKRWSKSCFPLRFLRIGKYSFSQIMPRWIRRILERRLGIINNVELRKSAD